MKIPHLQFLLCFLFFQINASVFAQVKIGLDIAPTVRFFETANTDFGGQNYFAIAGGVRSEVAISRRWKLEYGVDVTYYSSEEKVTAQFGNCLNCLRIAPDPNFFPGSIGSRRKYLEIDLPVLVKRKLLAQNKSLLNIFSGYSPSRQLSTTHLEYYADGENHFREKYRNPSHFFISFHLGLEYQFAISDRFTAATSIAYRHRFINAKNISLRANQYRIHFKVLYQI